MKQEQNKTSVLHILNGQYMYDYFQEKKSLEGVCIPFNEAMCVGEVDEYIFSDSFIEKRLITHQVSKSQYIEYTMKWIEWIKVAEYERIELWFDEDMFCQINLLTILAYLEQIGIKCEKVINVIDDNFEVINYFIVQQEAYNKLYQTAIINKEMPEQVPCKVMEQGIKRYLDLQTNDHEILDYIKANSTKENEVLVRELINQFKAYGLGDTQYLQMIKQVKQQ